MTNESDVYRVGRQIGEQIRRTDPARYSQMTSHDEQQLARAALAGLSKSDSSALIEAAAPFARVANIIDALPESHYPADDIPLRGHMPGVWPTVGDVRRLRDELVRLGWKA